MRLTSRFLKHDAVLDSNLSMSEWFKSNPSCFVATFNNLPDAELLGFEQLIGALEERQKTKQLILNSTIKKALLICLRKDQYYAVIEEKDVRQLCDGDVMFVMALASLEQPPTQLPAFDQALFKWYRELQPLRVTAASRPLSQRAQLLKAMDVAQPCQIARDDAQEPLFDAEEVLFAAASDPTSLKSSDLAAKLRATISGQGFVRIRLSSSQMKQVRTMQDMQKQYFALAQSIKSKHASVSSRGVSGNYQPPFGYTQSSSCHKEYFVVRQPLVTAPNYALHPSAASDDEPKKHTLPTAPVDMDTAVWPVFHQFGSICQALMRLILRSLNISEEKIDTILVDTMSPVRDELEFGHTSVIELFHYRRPPPTSELLPCSIHTDASLLTMIPRCVGPSGLELFNWLRGDWQAVESQAGDDECIVFPGDMMPRLVNGAVLATQHRVVLHPANSAEEPSGDDRYSTPFELFLTPSYVIDCADLLGSSTEILPGNERRESAQMASWAFSQGLVSVNQSDAAK